MVSLDIIENEIIELEKRDTSFATIERLAWLYIVRDNLRGDVVREQEKLAVKSTQSDFLKAVNGCPSGELFEILNEHFEIVKEIYPKEYTAVINRINNIREIR